MAVGNACYFPVYGQAFRFQCDLRLSTGALNTSPGTITSTVSIDGAAFAATTLAPTQIGSSGIYIIDLNAAEMSGYTVSVKISSNAVNAIDYVQHFRTLVLEEHLGHYSVAIVRRYEQVGVQSAAILSNKVTNSRASGIQAVYRRAAGDVMISGAYSETDDSATREAMY